jgi:hypothetical protein
VPSDIELVKLNALIADIDEELQKLKANRVLSAGQKLLKEHACKRERRKLELQVNLFHKKRLIEGLERDCEFYQTPLGQSVAAGKRDTAEKHRQKLLAGRALGGGSSTPYQLAQQDIFILPDLTATASVALTNARGQYAATLRALEELCGEDASEANGNANTVPSLKPGLHAKQPECLVFIKGKDGSFQVQPGYNEPALLNSYNQILPILVQVRAFLLARGNKKSVEALQRRFGSTVLGKVATSKNWELWIDDFKKKTTPKAATIFFLHEATGIKCETLGPRLSRVRAARETEKKSHICA